MSDDRTYIENPRPQQEDDYSSLPPMPPPPPPGSSGGGNRRWLVLGLLGGFIGLVICLAGGYFVWQYVQNGTLPFGTEPTQAVDGVGLTQTALVEQVQDLVLTTDTPEPPPTEIPTDVPPSDTPVPTETPTETLPPTLDVPVFTAGQAMFCRTGPSSIYQEVRTMNAGDKQQVLGQSISPVDGISIWWEVEVDGRRCFVSSALGTTDGDTSAVPVRPAPPTPTPTPTATPTYTPTPTATP